MMSSGINIIIHVPSFQSGSSRTGRKATSDGLLPVRTCVVFWATCVSSIVYSAYCVCERSSAGMLCLSALVECCWSVV